jgi:FkbM family methyltransferase
MWLTNRFPNIPDKADLYARETAKLILNYRGQRRVIVRRWKYDLLHFFTPIMAVEGHNGIHYFVSTSEYLGKCLYVDGFFEERQMKKATEVIQAMRGGPPPLKGHRFIDIGANIGTATITAIKVFGAEDGIGFEPEPDNFKLFQCNLVMNDLSSRVRAFQLALSNHPGTALLELSHANCGDHRVRVAASGDEGVFRESDRPTIKVQLARLDDLMAELNVRVGDVGLVWIDTQGHEGHVLEGATTVLSSDVPVVLEYWPYGLRRAGGHDLLHSLIAENYSMVIDLSVSNCNAVYRAPDIHQLGAQYSSTQSTDLLLLK